MKMQLVGYGFNSLFDRSIHGVSFLQMQPVLSAFGVPAASSSEVVIDMPPVSLAEDLVHALEGQPSLPEPTALSIALMHPTSSTRKLSNFEISLDKNLLKAEIIQKIPMTIYKP